MIEVDEYLIQLEVELKPSIQRILDHPFIVALDNHVLDLEQIKVFALQYGIYCNYFPRFLAACAANIPDDATRLPLIENLWEEHGEGVLSKSHRSLYYNFCIGLGLRPDEIQNAKAIPSTHIYVEYMLNLCQEGGFVKALGALGPGTEYFTSHEYKIIFNALQKFEFLDDKTLEFWSTHITLDEDHYAEMINGIKPWLTEESNRLLFSEGASRAIDLELLFWDGLEDYLNVH